MCVLALSSCVPVVIDVSVSPSSVGVLGEVSLSGSDCEFVESKSFSLSRKRSSELEDNQGQMGYERSPVKAPPNTRRRMMPPTPQQISHSSSCLLLLKVKEV